MSEAALKHLLQFNVAWALELMARDVANCLTEGHRLAMNAAAGVN